MVCGCFQKANADFHEQEILGDKVEKVQVSDRIVDSPCVLVTGE
jgi:HSP90 family molecular chaperone